MAKGPKTTKNDTPGAAADTSKSDDTATTLKKDETPVEDAVVVEETPPKPADAAKTTKPAVGKKPAPAKKDAESAEPDAPKSAPASKSTTAETSTTKPAEKATKPAEKPSVPPSENPRTPAKSAVGESKPAPAAPVPKQSGGFGRFVGLVSGGILAAVIGFVAARSVVPEGWPFPGVAPDVDPLVAVVDDQGTQLTAVADKLASLETDLAAVKSDTSALDGLRDTLSSQIAGLQQGQDDISSSLEALAKRVDAVEKLAPEGSAAAQAAAEAYDRELTALREMFKGELDKVAAAQADAAALEAQAAEAAKAAAGRAALARIISALDTGSGFDDALTELQASSSVAVPEALSSVAANGVPTLAALQSDFPAAARAAIDAATAAAVQDGSMSRAQAFLRTQLGTRSLEPKEGDDADAVLSRAEAALKQGDLAGVFAELNALPDAAKPAMSDWRTLAETRAAALAASAQLANDLNAK